MCLPTQPKKKEKDKGKKKRKVCAHKSIGFCILKILFCSSVKGKKGKEHDSGEVAEAEAEGEGEVEEVEVEEGEQEKPRDDKKKKKRSKRGTREKKKGGEMSFLTC